MPEVGAEVARGPVLPVPGAVERGPVAGPADRTGLRLEPESGDDAEWLRLFGETYKELTFDNANHFGTMKAMGGDLEGTNLGVWAEHHEEALGLAARAGEDPALADKARVTDAFGAHYLQDAFSAGHLIDKGAAVEAAGEVGLAKRKLLVAQAGSAVFDEHQDVIAAFEVCDLERNWRPFSRESFVLLMQAADVMAPEAFENAPGAVHDELSEQGVPVANDEACWVMRGDDQMDETSLQYASLATQRSADEVEAALAGGEPPVLDVLGLVPVPTEEGAAQVEASMADGLGDGMLDALVQQLGKQVEAFGGAAGATTRPSGAGLSFGVEAAEPRPSSTEAFGGAAGATTRPSGAGLSFGVEAAEPRPSSTEAVLDTAVEKLPWEVRRAPTPGGGFPDWAMPEPEIGVPGGEGPGECLPEPQIGVPGGEGPGQTLPGESTTYTVRAGDWLSTIAEQFDVLFRANRDLIPGFTDPNRIEPGWKLVIPL